jgi:signal transduction histidine kinase
MAASFTRTLAVSLALLALGLIACVVVQVRVGLAPLRRLGGAVTRLREGQVDHVGGDYPSEVRPLVEDLNVVLRENRELLSRARAQAGNLAHALKTPLAIMGQAARSAGPSAFSALVDEQVRIAERQVNWHLARARAAASRHLPGQRTPVGPVVDGLLRTMGRLHADRRVDLGTEDLPSGLAFAGEEQDLQEMVGNLLDNACRSARTSVVVRARRDGGRLAITVDDDGPGVPSEQRAEVMRRGVRLDEAPDRSGLGLAIVIDRARLYGGDLSLHAADTGGLSARLVLPAADERR